MLNIGCLRCLPPTIRVKKRRVSCAGVDCKELGPDRDRKVALALTYIHFFFGGGGGGG